MEVRRAVQSGWVSGVRNWGGVTAVVVCELYTVSCHVRRVLRTPTAGQARVRAGREDGGAGRRLQAAGRQLLHAGME